MESPSFNLSFYRFFRLQAERGPLQELRARLRPELERLGLRGTLLLSPEGVNAMVSGAREAIDGFMELSIREFAIEPRAFKVGQESVAGFNRLLIKIKKEIITVGNPALEPDRLTGARVTPQELKRWMDQGRPLLLLDTRNDYEIAVGTFRGARQLGLATSREFAAKASEAAPSFEGQTVVTFCTGGIRCEKASAQLLELGLKDVYQLDGGILRYLEENGAAHFDGSCFVFDWRMAVDGELKPVPRSGAPDAQFGRHRFESDER